MTTPELDAVVLPDPYCVLCLLSQTMEFSDQVRCDIQGGADEIQRLRAILADKERRAGEPLKQALIDLCDAADATGYLLHGPACDTLAASVGSARTQGDTK